MLFMSEDESDGGGLNARGGGEKHETERDWKGGDGD